MKKSWFYIVLFSLLISLFSCSNEDESVRENLLFNNDWRFMLGDDSLAAKPIYDDSKWRVLNLPHDWSIEGEFSKKHPTNQAGGALPAGIGWYRKSFILPVSMVGKEVSLVFDGVYRNSEVWINGHYLGKRPFGYISFQYNITSYLVADSSENIISVRVDNEDQPNSRWYTGSGIYRNVHLVATNATHIVQWGTFVTTPQVSSKTAKINLNIRLINGLDTDEDYHVLSEIFDAAGDVVAKRESHIRLAKECLDTLDQVFIIGNPQLWSPDHPNMYSVFTKILQKGKVLDTYKTPLGIRKLHFDAQKGFFINDKSLKIKGVCLHHDLGALGAAYNKRANQRQLEIMKDMGCNAIRTSHNPFDPQFYDLCDQMGFLVMDEAFDVWHKKKAKKDYHFEFDEWHKRDLEDMILRDRNHPSVFMYSCGNEIREQFDSTGIIITRTLVDIIKRLDTTRPVTNALTENQPEKNFIYQSKALDVLGFNYKHLVYDTLQTLFPGAKIIATESVSAIASRGHYEMPSDSVRIWPTAYNAPLIGANPYFTVSSYDNAHAYWGTTHEKNWQMIKKHDYVAGMFLWTGFDYIGEPNPYPYPARSSYLGVVDLCGFPKDTYYMYQSEWSSEPMLYIFPHWNWKPKQLVDVWAYFNNADEVELLLNDRSLGRKQKTDSTFHVMWHVPFEAGVLKAISYKAGKIVLEKEIKTAGKAANIVLRADRSRISADGVDLAFITVKITDKNGNMVPDADNLVKFSVSGSGFIAGVDNGYQASLEPFKASERKVFNGMCLAIIQNNSTQGDIVLKASSKELLSSEVTIICE